MTFRSGTMYVRIVFVISRMKSLETVMYDKMNSQSEKAKNGMKVLFFVLYTVLFQLYWEFLAIYIYHIAVILFGERYSGVITAIAIISSLVCAKGTSSYLYKNITLIR